MARINANLTNNEIQEGFEVLPPGDYHMRVADSDLKDAGKGNGPYIMWTFEVIGKPGRVFDNMSLGNEVAMNRLKSLAAACGHPNPNYVADTEELHGREFVGRLKVKEDPGYDKKNVISAFKPIKTNGAPKAPAECNPAATAPHPTTPPPQKPRELPKMPWEA